MDKKLTHLGKHLRELRIDRGETAKEMAKKLNVTSAYLSSIELGRRRMSINLKDKIINTYCYSKEDIDLIEELVIKDSTMIKLHVDHLNLEERKILFALIRQIKELSKEDLDKIRKIIEK